MVSFGRVLIVAVWLVLRSGVAGLAGTEGVEIRPDEKGEFRYADDFQTAKFLDDAFRSNLALDCWEKGAIRNAGPNGGRMLTYRFFGGRAITKIEVRVEQNANGPSLGGTNTLYLSGNGLDWMPAASSGQQKPDASGWQREPLTVSAEQAAAFLGRGELWVRLVLDNYSGLKTGTSNSIHSMEVRLSLGGTPKAEGDPQSEHRAAWGRLMKKTGWRPIVLDWADPAKDHPPHYYEDADGWLRGPEERGHLLLDEQQGLAIRKAYLAEGRSPLSLAVFVKTEGGSLMGRLIVRGGKDSSRMMKVVWDGREVGAFDVASYFEKDQAFFVELPDGPKGVHELRVAGADSGAVLIRQIALAGTGEVSWAAKPALPGGRSLEVLSAYSMSDPAPPVASQVVEGRGGPDEPVAGVRIEGLQRLYGEHTEFGGLRVVVRNNGKAPVRIGDRLVLDGKPIEEGYVDFAKDAWDARGVVWYRVRPRLLMPEECGEVYIRFRRRPEGEHAAVTIPIENGPSVEVKIPYADPGLQIDYATTGRSADQLYLYVRRPEGAGGKGIAEVTLDGRMIKNVKIYGGDFPGGVGLCVVTLPRPLKEGTYHVAGIRTDAGDGIAAQFRALPFTFPRSSIHVPPALCKSMRMNLAMWNEQSLETCETHGVDTTSTSLFDLHRRVRYVMGPDEPDAHDNRGGGYGNGLGWNARRLMESGWQELIERHARGAVSWIIMNGTTRPLNWWVYGQLADISCFDPYPVTYYGADHAYVRESLLTARAAGAPRRMYACLEAYGWGTGQGVPDGARGPTPAEYRQNVVQAIGAGIKGLTSWVHSAGAGGWQLNEPVAKEIAAMNALIESIEEELLVGTPVNLAESNAGQVMTGTVGRARWAKERVWVGSLLCGPDAMVVAAANHIPAVKPDPPNIDPAKDVTITVRLPDFLSEVKAFEATDAGVVSFPCSVQGGKAVLKADAIESGRVFLLRRAGG